MTETTKVPFPADHYKWLDAVSEEASKQLRLRFNPNDYSTAHGDKCYSYKFKWAKAGVPFERGVFVYLMMRADEALRPSTVRNQPQRRGAPVIEDKAQMVIDIYTGDAAARMIYGTTFRDLFDSIEDKLFA